MCMCTHVCVCMCLHLSVCIYLLKESSVTALPPGCLRSSGCVVTLHCGLNLHIPDNQHRQTRSHKLIVRYISSSVQCLFGSFADSTLLFSNKISQKASSRIIFHQSESNQEIEGKPIRQERKILM